MSVHPAFTKSRSQDYNFVYEVASDGLVVGVPEPLQSELALGVRTMTFSSDAPQFCEPTIRVEFYRLDIQHGPVSSANKPLSLIGVTVSCCIA